MNLAVERLPDCKAKLNIEIPSDVVEKERSGLVAAYTAQAKLPGYRPGKIPKAVIEKKFKNQITEELEDRLMRQAWGEADKQESLGILGISNVESKTFEADGSFAIAAEVITQPEVALPDYSDIPVEVPKIVVTDEQLDNVFERMQQNFATFEVVEGRALKTGDIAVVEYEGSTDGAPLVEILDEANAQLGSSEEYWIKIPGEGEDATFLPGFGEQLEGLEVGAEKDVELTLSDDFQIEALAGKTVVYKTKIKEVKEQVVPPLDDAFAEKIEPGKNIEEVRASIKEQMEAEQTNQRQEVITSQILSHLTGMAEFEVPEHIIFNETQRQVNEMVQRGYQQGMGEEQIAENQQAILDSAEGRAKSSVKATFLLEKIGEKEGLTVTDDEVSQQVMMMAAQEKRPIKKVARELRDKNAFPEIRHDILISKVLEFLKGNATITEVDPPAPEEAEEASEEPSEETAEA